MRHCVIFDTLKVDGLGDHSTKITYSESETYKGHCMVIAQPRAGTLHPYSPYIRPSIYPKKESLFLICPPSQEFPRSPVSSAPAGAA
jgi:hypothetical protein